MPDSMSKLRSRILWLGTGLVCSFAAFSPMLHSYNDLLCFFLQFSLAVIGATVCLVAFATGWKRAAGVTILLFTFILTSLMLDYFSEALFDYSHWLISARSAKERLLLQPAPPAGQLRHVPWNDWGFAGLDTQVYLVYDPSDTLREEKSAATNASGLPCRVWKIRRLEPLWYTVTFYTEQVWEHCDAP